MPRKKTDEDEALDRWVKAALDERFASAMTEALPPDLLRILAEMRE